MRFVTFDRQTGEIRSASSGPAESHLQNLESGFRVGDAGEFQLEGARQNYVFCPAPEQPEGAQVFKGTIQRKPREQWNLEEETNELKRKEVMEWFHHLKLQDVDHIDVYLIIPTRFTKLSNVDHSFYCIVEGLNLTVSLKRTTTASIPLHFGFGGYSVPIRQSTMNFTLTAQEQFIVTAVNLFLKEHPDGFDVFVSRLLQAECLKFSLRVANHLIESYRLAYDDAEARPLGIADPISAAMVVVLRDGYRTNYHTGNPYEFHLQLQQGQAERPTDQLENRMQALLLKQSPPFLPSAISALKTAHLYGQYRECVVWAGTIISNVVEDILLRQLPRNSKEYNRLKNEGDKVAGRTKRGSYFKLATGETLEELLDSITSAYQVGRQSDYWNKLSDHVENVLNHRNLLLHRKKAVTSKSADDAFFTCMNFIYAIEGRVAYTGTYSRDFNLRLEDPLL